jgi:hypothetical protein
MSSENWDKKELTSRGSLPSEMVPKSSLVIGAGAVGSILSELLVRAGVENMTIMDGDILRAGNLVRHNLTLNDINQYKVDSLVKRLSECSPHNKITGINKDFPLLGDDNEKMLNQHNVIIDCTAEDEVIHQLEKFEWKTEKKFVSISLGFGAKRLFIYVSQGIGFSSHAFYELINPWMRKEEKLTNGIEFPREGIGCWHPVFPARADDVWGMVAMAIKSIEAALENPIDKPKLLVYEQEWNDEVFFGTRLISQEEYDE